MSGEAGPEIARVEQDGRVLSGGTDTEQLAETMERHAPPEEKKPVGTDASASAPEAGAPSPAAQPVSRGRQRFADLTRERDEARGETTKERTAREAAERERDELKARLSQPPREATTEKPPASKPSAPKFTYPDFAEWSAQQPKDAEFTYHDYEDARAEARHQHWRAAEQAAESIATEHRTVQQHVEAYRGKHAEFVKTHADFDAVVAAAPQVSAVMARAALEGGPELAYYLATHADERAALDADTSHVNPNDPAFKAVVATTRRYLTALVASESKPAAPAAKPSFTPPPAPHPTVGASSTTTPKPSSEYAKSGDMDGYRAKRAAERGVTPRY